MARIGAVVRLSGKRCRVNGIGRWTGTMTNIMDIIKNMSVTIENRVIIVLWCAWCVYRGFYAASTSTGSDDRKRRVPVEYNRSLCSTRALKETRMRAPCF